MLFCEPVSSFQSYWEDIWREEAHTLSRSTRTKGFYSRHWPGNIRPRIETSFAPRLSSTPPTDYPTTRLQFGWTRLGKSCRSGESASSNVVSPDSKSNPGEDDLLAFPPRIVIAVKALACQLPSESGLPLSRYSIPELKREAIRRGLVASIGETTLWRWLDEDAIRPWCHRSWIFPRDPKFEEKAGLVLDLYEGIWEGRPLTNSDFVISTDEKTSIQARRRIHATLPPSPGVPMRVEHEYARKGAWAYLAAWDVRRAKIFGRCERKTGIVPFERLVAQVMRQEPYRSAKRVFWIMDNGSSHRGAKSVERLCSRWPTIIPVHTPVHASWLNQVEIYFSVLQRKVLTPNDFASLEMLRDCLFRFQKHYDRVAQPFKWKFTRKDLAGLMLRLKPHGNKLHKAA